MYEDHRIAEKHVDILISFYEKKKLKSVRNLAFIFFNYYKYYVKLYHDDIIHVNLNKNVRYRFKI